MGGTRGILAAQKSLVVPMELRLSNFRLNAYVVLVVSKQKGITLVFKTDPLQNVDVSSTFDPIVVIQKYIQKEIEDQLREMFREDLPGIIHKLSQRWIPGNTKVEAPYLKKNRMSSSEKMEALETMSAPVGLRRFQTPSYYPPPDLRLPRMASFTPVTPSSRHKLPSRAHSTLAASSSYRQLPSSMSSVTSFASSPKTPKHGSEVSVPGIEDYDPTYGMRPGTISGASTYGLLSRLWAPSRGLGDLTEDPIEDNMLDIDRTECSVDHQFWDESLYGAETTSFSPTDNITPSYQIYPTVGGGNLSRPRVYHSQSSKAPSFPRPASGRVSRYFVPGINGPLRSWINGEHDPLELGSPTRPSRNPHQPNSSLAFPSRGEGRTESYTDNPFFSGSQDNPERPKNNQSSSDRVSFGKNGFRRSPESSFLSRSSSGAITKTLSTPPSSEPPLTEAEDGELSGFRRRKSSAPQPFDISLDPTFDINHSLDSSPNHDALRPSANNTAQLAILSQSNHTLSPFTRSLEHFTVRSVPHHRRQPPKTSRSKGSNTPPERQPVKARRRRVFHLGNSKPSVTLSSEGIPSFSPSVPSEISEVDHYFSKANSPHPRQRDLMRA